MRRRTLLIATVLLGLAPNVRAHVVSDREVVLLATMSRERLEASASTDAIDSLGSVGSNRGGWRSLRAQRGATPVLWDAVAHADSVRAEREWLALEAAFRHQGPAGDFDSAAAFRSEPPDARALADVADWLADVCHTQIVVMNSPLQRRFAFRMALLMPKLRRSLDAFASHAGAVERAHAGRPDLQLVDAQVFLLGDGIFHVPEWNALGERALTPALRAQRRDGAIGTANPPIAAQARALSALAVLTTYFPSPILDQSAAKAAAWLERRLSAMPLGAARRDVGDDRLATPREAVRDALLALAYRAELARDGADRSTVAALAARWDGWLRHAAP